MSKESTFAWFFLAEKVCIINDYSYLCSNRIRHASHLNSEPGRVFCFL